MKEKFRILLVEAPYSYGSDKIAVEPYFPLGIGYLASYVRQKEYDVRIFQAKRSKAFYAEFIEEIKKFDPHLVGISAMTPAYPEALRICKLTKMYTKAKTTLGGCHISALNSKVFRDTDHVDFLVIGEGELTFSELASAVRKGSSSFSDIDGLIWKGSSGDIIANSLRKFIEDIDTLPFPARDLVDIFRYGGHSYISFGKRVATMISSRGCPFSCSFCSSFLTMGRKYRLRSSENVLAEVDELTSRHKIDHVIFEDDVFTLDRERLLRICEGFRKRKISWYCLSRVDNIDLATAEIMKESGCRMINFGIESGSPEILKKINKRLSLKQAKEAIASCNKVGLRTQATFILGFPFDTLETMKMTLSAAKKLSPSIAIFFPLIPYPGTEIFENHLPQKLRPKSPEEWNRFVVTSLSSCVGVNNEYTPAYIRHISKKWTLNFYLRPSQIFRLVKTVKSRNEFLHLLRSGMMLIMRYCRTDRRSALHA